MRAAGVVEAYPVADDTACVLQGLKAMTMRALLLERTDDPLDHAVLLRLIQRDELLAQAIVAHQRGIAVVEVQMALLPAQNVKLPQQHLSQRIKRLLFLKFKKRER